MHELLSRREFLGIAAAGAIATVAAPLLAAAPAEEITPAQDPYAGVHVGLLMTELRPGGFALVECPNPYHGGVAIYTVTAGRFVNHPWPIGHPVAFASIDGSNTTIGW